MTVFHWLSFVYFNYVLMYFFYFTFYFFLTSALNMPIWLLYVCCSVISKLNHGASLLSTHDSSSDLSKSQNHYCGPRGLDPPASDLISFALTLLCCNHTGPLHCTSPLRGSCIYDLSPPGSCTQITVSICSQACPLLLSGTFTQSHLIESFWPSYL